MQESGGRGLVSQNFHDSQCAHGGGVARTFRDVEAEPDMRLPCQMIELVRLHFADNSSNRGGVVQIGIVQEQTLVVDVFVNIQMLESRPFHGAGTPDEAVDFVAFFQQQFGQVRTVLTGDTGNECDGRGGVQRVVFGVRCSVFGVLDLRRMLVE